jgi:hypothetical protein
MDIDQIFNEHQFSKVLNLPYIDILYRHDFERPRQTESCFNRRGLYFHRGFERNDSLRRRVPGNGSVTVDIY